MLNLGDGLLRALVLTSCTMLKLQPHYFHFILKTAPSSSFTVVTGLGEAEEAETSNALGFIFIF